MSGGALRALILSGPTGVGKSRVALSLAQQLNGEIISADSMQVYRGLDIGTDKPSAHARGLVPHHLVDETPIDRQFTAGEFVALARDRIAEVAGRGKVPIVVGGTPYYLHVLIHGVPTAAPADDTTRATVAARLHGLDWAAAATLLGAKDPVYAASLQRNDWRRLERALCIIEMTGKPLAVVRDELAAAASAISSEIDFRCVALTADRTALFRSIDNRAERIVGNGLVEETVQQLLRPGARPNPSILQALGYKQAIAYLEDYWLGKRWTSAQSHRHALTQLVHKYQAATRQFSRRQMTWYRGSDSYTWVDASGLHDPEIAVDTPQHEEVLGGIVHRLTGLYAASKPQAADPGGAQRRAAADRARVAKAQHVGYIPALAHFTSDAVLDAKVAEIHAALQATLNRNGDWRTATTPPEEEIDEKKSFY